MSEGLLHKIDITIAGRKYPIKVTADEETIVRNIEKQLNHQIHEFQLKYADKDKLDCILMTLLTIAFDNAKKEASSNKNILAEKIDDIEKLLESVIK